MLPPSREDVLLRVKPSDNLTERGLQARFVLLTQ
jgi:hypothetical protein